MLSPALHSCPSFLLGKVNLTYWQPESQTLFNRYFEIPFVSLLPSFTPIKERSSSDNKQPLSYFLIKTIFLKGCIVRRQLTYCINWTILSFIYMLIPRYFQSKKIANKPHNTILLIGNIWNVIKKLACGLGKRGWMEAPKESYQALCNLSICNKL